MKSSKLFSLAALALMIASCSDQIEQVQQPRNTEGIPFTATISTEGHAATRLLAESGTSITATWASGEKVALIYTVGTTTYLEEATVTPQTGGTATISTTLEGSPADDTDVTIVYPASAVDESTKDVKTDLLTSQNGLLTGTGSISEKYDLRKTSTPAKLKIDGTTASLKGTVSLAQQVSVWKLTLQNGGVDVAAKTLTIKDASDNLLASAALTTAGSVFYVAVPDMTSVKLIAANGANSYSYSKSSVSISVGKYYQSTINLTPDYTDLSATATANTYIISSAGKYKFNATIKGNGGLDPLTGTTATPISKSSIAGVKVLWELGDTYGKAIKYSGGDYDISYSDGYVYFSTPETFQSGNAYVAVYDNSNNILWSWLIWATSAPTEQTAGSEKFMNCNLGAISVGNYNSGFCYEWGRKDPFPAADGGNYTPYTYVPERMTCHAIQTAGSGVSIANSIMIPTTYLDDNPWVNETDYKNYLWSDFEKTIYDPCPAGWRVPTKAQMNTFHSQIGLGTLPQTGFIGNCGSDFGYGNPGTGYYWSSTGINRSNAYAFDNGGRVDQQWPIQEGYAIRPVKEPGPATSKSLASLTTDEIGWRIGSDGNAYSPGILPTGVTAVAMVAYVGAAGSADASSSTYKGLALALTDAGTGAKWCTQSSSTCLTNQYPSESEAKGDMAGIANTDALVAHSHTHAAASAARNFSVARPAGTSEWFLPSVGQWDKMATAVGGYANLGLGADEYWTSSERGGNFSWCVRTGVFYTALKDNYNYLIRPCFAF